MSPSFCFRMTKIDERSATGNTNSNWRTAYKRRSNVTVGRRVYTFTRPLNSLRMRAVLAKTKLFTLINMIKPRSSTARHQSAQWKGKRTIGLMLVTKKRHTVCRCAGCCSRCPCIALDLNKTKQKCLGLLVFRINFQIHYTPASVFWLIARLCMCPVIVFILSTLIIHHDHSFNFSLWTQTVPFTTVKHSGRPKICQRVRRTMAQGASL